MNTKMFGSSLSNSSIKAVNAYGWGVQFKKGSIQNLIVSHFGVFHLGTRIRNRILSSILSKRNLKEKELLDAGCGIGLASIFYSSSFKNITSVDLEKHKIAQAKSLAKENKVKNISFKDVNLIKPPFTKKKFDMIICFEVIEHVENDVALLTGFSKMLDKKGELILSFPSKSYMSRIAQKSLDHFKVGYIPSDIKRILTKINLKVMEEYSFGNSILGKSIVFVDFLLRKTVPLVASALFPVFYPLLILDYHLPKLGIPRGYVLVIHKK